jgi:hypothetical protein
MRKKLKPTPESKDTFHFYAQVHNPADVDLLRRACAQLGWPSNSATLHLLAAHYLKSNGELQL